MTKKPWQWLTDSPTTNGQIVLGMFLSSLCICVPLYLMVMGQKERIGEAALGLVLGAALGLSGVSTYQKVQKWREMPASGEEEPPPGSAP